MRHPTRRIVWLLALILLKLPTDDVWATPCLYLVGIVQDQLTHHPLAAQLYIQTPTGRIRLGTSSAQTGAFSVTITCPVTELLIQRPGYRPQQLPLNISTLTSSQLPISLIIPLIAVDTQDVNKPYQQTEQTHFEQKSTTTGRTQPQHNHFTISDALTKIPLVANVCLYFTKDGQKKCLNSNSAGEFSFSFKDKDIVAIEVSASGYQSYYGNLIVDELDGRHLIHQIRLTRVLTLLSVQLDAADYRCRLLIQGTKSVIPLLSVADSPYSVVANNLSQRTYRLIISDSNQNIVEQRQLNLVSGLNFIKIDRTDRQHHPPEPITNPDSLPFIYFEQSSFILRPESKTLLLRIAAHMSKYPGVNIQIFGHTDREGDERLNRSLSQNRAKVVSNFLGANGISDTQMTVTGYGSQYTIAPSDKEENKARNRRVQLKLISR